MPTSRGVRLTVSWSRWAVCRPRSMRQLAMVHDLLGCRLTVGSAGEGLDPCQQFTDAEGFGDVVVGTRRKPGNLVVLGAPCGQHQHVKVRSRDAKSAADFQPVQTRQHEVENHEIEGTVGAHVEP